MTARIINISVVALFAIFIWSCIIMGVYERNHPVTNTGLSVISPVFDGKGNELWSTVDHTGQPGPSVIFWLKSKKKVVYATQTEATAAFMRGEDNANGNITP